MNELALFAGAGGGILGGHLLGWCTVCAVEIDDYARRVLLARQRDGFLPRFPIWDDITTFDGNPWRGRIDVISGGFPCQDISAAGRGAGITGARSGLWSHMARVVSEVRPRFVFVENSPLLISRGLDCVLSDLAALGYDARWGIVGAHHAGAMHKRDRIWIVANAEREGLEGHAGDGADRHQPGRDHAQPGGPTGTRRVRIKYAHECPHCNCCDEPWCEEHGEHYGECECIGPAQADEWGFQREQLDDGDYIIVPDDWDPMADAGSG